MKTISRILWGLALVAGGAVLMLNATGVADIDVFFKGWWTLFIIVPSAIGLFEKEGRRASLVGLIAGIALLLAAQEVIAFDIVWKIILAAVLVIVGLSCIFSTKNKEFHKVQKSFKHRGDEDEGYTVAFAGQKLKVDGEELEDLNVKTIFGGLELDLRDAVIKKDVTIDVTAICGGVDILVPSGVVVKTNNSASFCGGVNDKSKHEEKKGDKTLQINISAVFGGVEIK